MSLRQLERNRREKKVEQTVSLDSPRLGEPWGFLRNLSNDLNQIRAEHHLLVGELLNYHLHCCSIGLNEESADYPACLGSHCGESRIELNYRRQRNG